MGGVEFKPWPKIYRLRRPVIVTEKIDGTNASVYVPDNKSEPLLAGSRTRWLSLESDNFGFARWVHEHEAELRQLGPGHHFGEWWGAGIQRRYGLAEKRFSLFNVGRWNDETPPPPCCCVVPVLVETDSLIDTTSILGAVEHLRTFGSVAAPGFKRPEGIVIYHEPSGFMFKMTLENDDAPKGISATLE